MELKMKPNQLIILGGGVSVNAGIELDLWDKIKDHYVIGLNFSFKTFNPTFTCFVDPISFYRTYKGDIFNLPLIVGRYSKDIVKDIWPNTILLKDAWIYKRDCSEGVYNIFLCGIFGLSLAIYLADKMGIKDIFMLGIDGGMIIEDKDKFGKYRSHYYQDQFIHKGTGKIKTYHKDDAIHNMYKAFEQVKDINIYNVSPLSRILQFPKIDYLTFFDKLETTTYDQDLLRLDIKQHCIDLANLQKQH
jgi:hypothetical protein